jgi:hypothetical protein
VAEQDDHIYLDLADASWRAVEVDSSGWRLTSAPPIRFIRTPGCCRFRSRNRAAPLRRLQDYSIFRGATNSF